jgi:hypothetical protein
MKQRKKVNCTTLVKLLVPFDQGKPITGIGNKVKKSPFQKQMQKLRERIEQEKDEDIKRELKKGNIVQIISNDNIELENSKFWQK